MEQSDVPRALEGFILVVSKWRLSRCFGIHVILPQHNPMNFWKSGSIEDHTCRPGRAWKVGIAIIEHSHRIFERYISTLSQRRNSESESFGLSKCCRQKTFLFYTGVSFQPRSVLAFYASCASAQKGGRSWALFPRAGLWRSSFHIDLHRIFYLPQTCCPLLLTLCKTMHWSLSFHGCTFRVLRDRRP